MEDVDKNKEKSEEKRKKRTKTKFRFAKELRFGKINVNKYFIFDEGKLFKFKLKEQ